MTSFNSFPRRSSASYAKRLVRFHWLIGAQIFEQVRLVDMVACARSCKRFATALRSSNYLWVSIAPDGLLTAL